MSNSESSTGQNQLVSEPDGQISGSLGDATKRLTIWELAVPSILGNLSYTIVGMVQTKFVGELGPQALAAVGAGQQLPGDLFGLRRRQLKWELAALLQGGAALPQLLDGAVPTKQRAL